MLSRLRLVTNIARPTVLPARSYLGIRGLATKTDEEETGSLLGSLSQDVKHQKRNNDSLVSSKSKRMVAAANAERAAKASDTDPTDPDQQQVKYVEPEDDKKLQWYLNPKPYKTVNSLLSPLKRRIYLDNVAKNGFFKNKEKVTLADGSEYSLKLSREEIEALEPSIFLRSWRIKSSVKKTNPVLRALKGLPLKKAITQLHFMPKQVSRDLAEMLERGLEDAETMQYDPDQVYVAESWVHTDGSPLRRPEWKGRGRHGVIRHRYVSVRFLLKTEQTKKRLAYEAKVKAERKGSAKSFLTASVLRGQSPGWYKW